MSRYKLLLSYLHTYTHGIVAALNKINETDENPYLFIKFNIS